MMREVDRSLFMHLRALEESLWRSSTRFDDSLMDATFAPDFFEYGRSGRRYRRDEMFFGDAELGEIDVLLPLPEFEARFLSDEVVQVTYISEVKYDGVVERGNRSSIWSLIEGCWRLRFHQGTAVPGDQT